MFVVKKFKIKIIYFFFNLYIFLYFHITYTKMSCTLILFCLSFHARILGIHITDLNTLNTKQSKKYTTIWGKKEKKSTRQNTTQRSTRTVASTNSEHLRRKRGSNKLSTVFSRNCGLFPGKLPHWIMMQKRIGAILGEPFKVFVSSYISYTNS